MDGAAAVRVDTVSATADSAFVALLASEVGALRRLARVLIADAEAADDLVGEAIARTLPRWRAGRVADPGAYVRRTLVNLASRRWRRLALGRQRDHVALEWLPVAPDQPDLVAERDRTWRAVLALPVRRRAIVVLRFYEDLSLQQIAAVLGVSEGTVKSQLSRGLEQLRSHLVDQEEA